MKACSHRDLWFFRGGKAERKKPAQFNPKQLRIGTKVEMEHTKDRCIAQRIAMDHLTEDPNYYKKLVMMCL